MPEIGREHPAIYGKKTNVGDTAAVIQSISGDNISLSDFLSVNAFPFLFDGTNWNRKRNNAEITVLASAARNSTTNSPDQVNYNARGVFLIFDITAVPGVDTVQLAVQAKDPVSGGYKVILLGTAINATGRYLYIVYPGVADTGSNFDAFEEVPLPRTWRVQIVHSAGTNFTYSVGASYIL